MTKAFQASTSVLSFMVVIATWISWPACRRLIAWHGLAGNPGYRLAGSTSAVWRLLRAFRDLARPDQTGLRILPGT